MKIIADTNIWYYFGQEKSLFNQSKLKPISPTFVNIYELSKSLNLIDNEELSRSAMRMLFKFKENVIFEPPIIYIAKLHQDYTYNYNKEIGGLLEFSEKFANGHEIDIQKKEELKAILDNTLSELTEGADLMNKETQRIKENIKNKKEHKQQDTIQFTAGFINFCVETITNGNCNLENFELNRIELLIRSLDYFFKTLEISKMNFQPNDWFDFMILGYVQPGDKYWTKEKRWLNLIRAAGCEEYLYNE